jgi:hypothetical protein
MGTESPLLPAAVVRLRYARVVRGKPLFEALGIPRIGCMRERNKAGFGKARFERPATHLGEIQAAVRAVRGSGGSV